MGGAVAFREALYQLLSRAEISEGSIEVNARQLHDLVLGRGSPKNEMPTCCGVMWQEFSEELGDTVVYSPPKRKGSRLTIRYVLPRRTNAIRGLPPSLSEPDVEESVLSADAVSIFTSALAHLSDRSSVADAAILFQQAKGSSLRQTISTLQHTIKGKRRDDLVTEVNGIPLDQAFGAALLVKAVSAQVNEVVHACSILLSIPKILDPDEVIERTSLAAGNTGSPYDLETNKRVAEFKIIDWKGADSVRQSQLFKDFFALAEADTPKRKFLYVTGLSWAEKALRSGRDCQSVLKERHLKILTEKYPGVRSFAEYCALKSNDVQVVGLDELLLEFASIAVGKSQIATAD